MYNWERTPVYTCIRGTLPLGYMYIRSVRFTPRKCMYRITAYEYNSDCVLGWHKSLAQAQEYVQCMCMLYIHIKHVFAFWGISCTGTWRYISLWRTDPTSLVAKRRSSIPTELG